MNALIANNEAERLEALWQYQILDTEPEEAFDDIAHLAAQICGTPIALINLIDANRQWFKSKVGLDVAELPRGLGLCPLCIEQRDVVIVSDTLADEQFATNPVVASYPYIRFYAGVPLITPEGHAIGTLCLVDHVPREISFEQVEAVRALSRQVVRQLELRRHLAELAEITIECKRLEAQLSRTEKQLSDFLAAEEKLIRIGIAVESTSDAIGIADVSGKSTYHNQAFVNLYSYTIEELNASGGLPALFAQPEMAEQVFEAIGHDRSWIGEVKFKTKTGGIVPTLLRADCIMDDSSKSIGLICICTDITSRKRVEDGLRETENLLRPIIETAPECVKLVISDGTLLDITSDAIFVEDLDRKILFWNKGAESLYGWKAKEALGKNASQLLYKETVPQLQEVEKILARKGSWRGELHQLTKDGKDIIVESRKTVVRDQAGQPKSILIVNSDITQKKQLESQFLRAQRMESLGTLAGGIAHDLNNVLAPIMMGIQVLETQLQDERSKRLLPILKINTKRGAALVKQVLSFVQGIEGQRQIIQVGHIISEIKQIAKQTFPKSIDICTDIPQNLWTVSGDITQLHQVFMNLCVNARDAMPDGGTLSITAENIFIDENYAKMSLEVQIGSYIVITVADTGTGIPPEIVDRIFEPFFTTKQPGKGTGLGLSTVISIIKSHGGFVNVDSEVGRRTQFKVYLPAVEATETEMAQDFALPTGNGELILVVDDEPAIRDLTKNCLETYNYKVILASDGIEALALYAQHKHNISVVLLDMMMPLMDGSTTIRTLQKMNPLVKILAVSGLLSSEQLNLTSDTSVKTFLSKPYTAKELLKSLHKVLIA